MQNIVVSMLLVMFIGCTKISYMHGEKVSITGQARNAKAGAILVAGDSIYYVDGLAAWEDKMLSGKVTVTGRLIEKTFSNSDFTNEKGEIQAGLTGKIKIIEQATWVMEER
jgi:hypothetical protein